MILSNWQYIKRLILLKIVDNSKLYETIDWILCKIYQMIDWSNAMYNDWKYINYVKNFLHMILILSSADYFII